MLNKKYNEADVRQLFAGHGTIEECTVLRDQNGQSKGCAFVTFDTKQHAIGAIKVSACNIIELPAIYCSFNHLFAHSYTTHCCTSFRGYFRTKIVLPSSFIAKNSHNFYSLPSIIIYIFESKLLTSIHIFFVLDIFVLNVILLYSHPSFYNVCGDSRCSSTTCRFLCICIICTFVCGTVLMQLYVASRVNRGTQGGYILNLLPIFLFLTQKFHSHLFYGHIANKNVYVSCVNVCMCV